MDDYDAEEAHLALLSKQLIQPSPLQPPHHDFLQRAPPSVLPPGSVGPPSVAAADRGPSTPAPPATPSQAQGDGIGSGPGKSGVMSVSQFQAPATPGPPMTPMTPITPGSQEPGILPQLQNIVSTVNLGCKLDLKKIALHARNAEYNPKRFAAVIMRIREPRTTALIFSSGKMVCTGAKSEESSRLAARKYARIVQKLGFDVSAFNEQAESQEKRDVSFPFETEKREMTRRRPLKLVCCH